MKTSASVAALLLACAASAAPRLEPDCAHVVFQPEDAPVSKPATLTSGGETLAVRLILANRRPLLPWESDVFQVCLDGAAPRVEEVSTAYHYRVVNGGALDGNVVLAAGAKRALPPDPRGVQAALTPGLALDFHDQWAAYYGGGEVVLKIALKRELDVRPDETVVQKEVRFPVAGSYSVELGGAALASGGIYYAEYSVKRLGA